MQPTTPFNPVNLDMVDDKFSYCCYGRYRNVCNLCTIKFLCFTSTSLNHLPVGLKKNRTRDRVQEMCQYLFGSRLSWEISKDSEYPTIIPVIVYIDGQVLFSVSDVLEK